MSTAPVRSAAPVHAEMVAPRALGYLTGHNRAFDALRIKAGVSDDDVRRCPLGLELMVMTLDFLLANEPALLAFSEPADLPPETIYDARRSLARQAAARIAA